jgi:hypothetical protein
VTVGHGPRLFTFEAMEAVEWVLCHFFWPNQTLQWSPRSTLPRRHQTCKTRYIDLIPFLCVHRRSDPFSLRNMTRRNTGGAPVLFMDADVSKEEEGVARVVDHARDLCVRARVDDAEFKAVEGDGGGVKRGATTGRGGGGANSASTITMQSSNNNLMVAGSDLGPTGLDLSQLFFIF